MTQSYRITFITILCFILVLSFFVAVPRIQAAEKVNDPDLYLALQAKVVYLQAVLADLQKGQGNTPKPTFVVGLSGSTATVSGTLTRPAVKDAVEVCGPMQKGTVVWGDGTITGLVGLGCSGEVYTFEARHTFKASNSYAITLNDVINRQAVKQVAVVVK